MQFPGSALSKSPQKEPLRKLFSCFLIPRTREEKLCVERRLAKSMVSLARKGRGRESDKRGRRSPRSRCTRGDPSVLPWVLKSLPLTLGVAHRCLEHWEWKSEAQPKGRARRRWCPWKMSCGANVRPSLKPGFPSLSAIHSRPRGVLPSCRVCSAILTKLQFPGSFGRSCWTKPTCI